MQTPLTHESNGLIDFSVENFNNEGVLELRKSFSEKVALTLIDRPKPLHNIHIRCKRNS